MAKKKTEKPNLVTYAKYAEMAGTSKQVISARVISGTMQAIRIGGIPFIDLNIYPVSMFGPVKLGRRPKNISENN